MARRKLRICWPDPDDVCLQGGCTHCRDKEPIPIRMVLNSLTPKRKAFLYERLDLGINL